jgi:hypothetical protein
LDTNATTSSIRTKLASLDVCVMTIGLLTDQLVARGQTTNDLLVFLFKGHGAVPDMEFKSCIKRKKENHKEGGSVTPEKLMLLADSKHKFQLESAEGWGMANPQEEKILDLEARLAKIPKGSKGESDRDSNENPNKRRKGDGKQPKKAKPASFMEHAPPKGDLVNPFKPASGMTNLGTTAASSLAESATENGESMTQPTARAKPMSSRMARKNLARKVTKTIPVNSSLQRLMPQSPKRLNLRTRATKTNVSMNEQSHNGPTQGQGHSCGSASSKQ